MKTLAVIGATGFASERMIPEVIKQKNARIVSIQGRNEKELVKICDKYKIKKYFTDVEKMLKEINPDCVYTATPPYKHLEDLKIIFSHKIPVICEKPLAQSLEEANKIKDLFQKDQIFMLGHHMRHQEAIRDIKNIIDKKEIGEVIFVEAQWGYNLDPNSKIAFWKLREKLGGKSVFGDPGIHIIDLFISLFGKPNSVIAEGFSFLSKDTYDNATCILNYNKMNAVINNSQTMSKASNDLSIYGTKGKIIVRNGISQESIKELEISTEEKKTKKNYKIESLYANEVEGLFNKNRGVPGTSFEEAILGMQILDAIHKSINTGKRIFL